MNKSLLAYSHWLSELLASGFTYSPSQFKCTFFFYNSWWFLLKYHQFYNIVLFCSSGEKVDLLYSFRINEFVISTGFSQTCKKPYFQVAFLCTVLGSHWHPWNCVFQQTRRKHLIVKYVSKVLKKYLLRQKDTFIPKWSCDNVYVSPKFCLGLGLLRSTLWF